MGPLLSLLMAVTADQGIYRVEPTAAETERLLAGNDDDWRPAARLSFGPSSYRTSFRALWGGAGLYLRFDVVDPDPWHTMTKRDQHLWEEELGAMLHVLVGCPPNFRVLQRN